MRTAIVCDPAHGANVSGKQSPDGKHKEYLWSRERIRQLMFLHADNYNYDFDLLSPFLSYTDEPGLTTRVDYYNQFVVPNYDRTIVLSLHNDAAPKAICDAEGWTTKANGIAVWTSKGQDKSDEYATFLWQEMKKLIPDQHFRSAYWEGNDPDYEQNFTILAGNRKVEPLYDAVLIEVLFQNNKSDVEKLIDPNWNNNFVSIFYDIICRL
jgi:N-acetylmuramoyl-L-alanine amidase